MTDPLTITPRESAVKLTGPLTDGHRHAAMVVDPAAASSAALSPRPTCSRHSPPRPPRRASPRTVDDRRSGGR